MTKNQPLAVFDMDGTLLNSMPKLNSDLVEAFDRLGIAIPEDQLRSYKNWYDLAAVYGIDKEKFDNAFNQRKSWTQSLQEGKAPLFEDSLPCLEALAENGIVLSLLTKSDPRYTAEKIDFYGLGKYFGDRIGVSPVTEKTKSRVALELMSRIPSFRETSQAYFIGDNEIDVTVEKDVRDHANWIKAEGIYVNRNQKPVPEVLQNYRVVGGLKEVSDIILNAKDG